MGSDGDEQTCRRLCEGLGIELLVERPRLPEGNLQAAAREARYAAAERLRAERGAAWIATGHSRTDLAETMLYRLASSPGARALLGLPARRGRLVRPLLGLTREQLRSLAEAAGLPFADDPSNADPRFARSRLRTEVLPVLRQINPAAEENIAATRAELAEDSEALESLAAGLLEQAGAARGATAAVPASALEDAPAALRRLALRALAERAAGRPVALAARRGGGDLAAGEPPRGRGAGARRRTERGLRGRLRALQRRRARRRPGRSRSVSRSPARPASGAGWCGPSGPAAGPSHRGRRSRPSTPPCSADRLEVRCWREGDRMRPLGLQGSKSLQDLFTDAGVPRSLRRALPVVAAGERIAWIAGVAVSEEFKLSEGSTQVVLLSAALADPG